MAQTKKPCLSVLPGANADDIQALAALYEAVTGQEPTRQELEEARAILDAPDKDAADSLIDSSD